MLRWGPEFNQLPFHQYNDRKCSLISHIETCAAPYHNLNHGWLLALDPHEQTSVKPAPKYSNFVEEIVLENIVCNTSAIFMIWVRKRVMNAKMIFKEFQTINIIQVLAKYVLMFL